MTSATDEPREPTKDEWASMLREEKKAFDATLVDLVTLTRSDGLEAAMRADAKTSRFPQTWVRRILRVLSAMLEDLDVFATTRSVLTFTDLELDNGLSEDRVIEIVCYLRYSEQFTLYTRAVVKVLGVVEQVHSTRVAAATACKPVDTNEPAVAGNKTWRLMDQMRVHMLSAPIGWWL